METFSTTPRWRPEDVNRAVDILVGRLQGAGVPVEVHQPEIYLSVPYSASVMAGGTTCRAKPPSSSLSVPGGRTAKLVALQANLKALRSYNRDVATLFGGSMAMARMASPAAISSRRQSAPRALRIEAARGSHMRSMAGRRRGTCSARAVS